ncbi:hypothetical protein AB0I51_03975 [Streptomyces sp. NPDC050549]|uniref:hypothetical protein n=1 Tax=Streptomyces sp. NPDC050549 TaxID=3155406 RepID=UPI00341FFE34
MSLLGRRKAVPRLTPELDDSDLGQVCRRLAERGVGNPRSLAVAVIEQLLDSTGQDWDRRCHRLMVLAEASLPGVHRLWMDRRPDHPDALTLFAWGVMSRGRLTPPAPDESRLAWHACLEAARLRPTDPCPWIVRLGLLRQARRPNEEVFPLWREITARDPWNREAHLQMFGYLSPGECGSRGQVLDFVDKVRATAPGSAPTAALPLWSLVERYHATLEQGAIGALNAVRLWEHREATQVLDTATATWHRPGHLTHAALLTDLNLLAYTLCEAKKWALAADVFAAVRGRVTLFPWARGGGDPVSAFTSAQQRADGAAR